MNTPSVTPAKIAYIPLASDVRPGDRPLMAALPVDCFTRGTCGEASPLKQSVDRQAEDPAASTVRELMQELSGVRNRHQAVKRDWEAAGRDYNDAENELRWARFPLQRAERDNERTDVSWEGREIDRHFRDTRREIDAGTHDLLGARFDLDQIATAVQSSQQRLRGLIQDLSQDRERYGAVLTHLQQAAGSLDAASTDYSRSTQDTDEATRGARDVQRDLDFSQHLVQDIVFDRPGQDVSSSARRLASRRDWMEWNLTSAERDVRDADTGGTSADQNTAQAQDALARALAELTRA